MLSQSTRSFSLYRSHVVVWLLTEKSDSTREIVAENPARRCLVGTDGIKSRNTRLGKGLIGVARLNFRLYLNH